MTIAEFIGFRYFIVPDQANLFYRDGQNDDRREAFVSDVLANREFEARRKVVIAITGVSSKNGLIFGKIGKRRTALLATRTEDDICSIPVETWPFLHFVCEPTEQLIAVEWRSEPGFTIDSLRRTLEEHAASQLRARGYVVRFAELVRRNAFWDLVTGAKVRSVRFTMSAPNLFGATAAAEDSLRTLSGIFNNTEIDVRLTNPMGKLRTPEDELRKYTEYCDRGGGRWEVTISRGRKRERRKSADEVIKVSVDCDEGVSQEALERAIEKVVGVACQLTGPSGP